MPKVTSITQKYERCADYRFKSVLETFDYGRKNFSKMYAKSDRNSDRVIFNELLDLMSVTPNSFVTSKLP